jgi:translation initiation factor IF-3
MAIPNNNLVWHTKAIIDQVRFAELKHPDFAKSFASATTVLPTVQNSLAVARAKSDSEAKEGYSFEATINEEILDKEVRLIGADGQQLGIVSRDQALRMAEEEELDLVKISPNAVPPVCKLMNYGKYRFEILKKEKEARKNQKVTEIKEIRLSMTIDTGDMNVKAKQAIKFLQQGNKVKVTLRMRGRQNARSSLCVEVMNTFFELVKDVAVMTKKPLTEGRSIMMMLDPVNA